MASPWTPFSAPGHLFVPRLPLPGKCRGVKDFYGCPRRWRTKAEQGKILYLQAPFPTSRPPGIAFLQIPLLRSLQARGIVLSLTKGKTGLHSSGVGASQRCGSGTPLKPHSLYRVFPLNLQQGAVLRDGPYAFPCYRGAMVRTSYSSFQPHRLLFSRRLSRGTTHWNTIL